MLLKKISVASSLITLFIVFASMATVTDTLRIFHHKEIVITATRSIDALENLALSASVVYREDFAQANPRMLTDALNSLPGVLVLKTGDFGRSDVVIRGIGDRDRSIGIMLDGRPDKMAIFGCGVTHSLPMGIIDRIELIRGPNSVIYGSGAIGGVLNIITEKSAENFEGDLYASYGSFRSEQYRLRVGGNIGRFDYLMSGSYNFSDGYLDNSGYDSKDAAMKLGYGITPKIDITLSGKYFDGYKEEPLTADDTISIESNVWNKYERWGTDLSSDADFGRVKFSLNGHLNGGEHLFSDGWHSRDLTSGAVIDAKIGIPEKNRFIIGADFRRLGGEAIEDDTTKEWSKFESGVFAYDKFEFSEKLIFSGGLRVNYDEIAGMDLSPQIGVVSHLFEGSTIRLSVSKGFRSPQINELFAFPPSNEDLEPEIAWNYEAGIRQRINDNWFCEITGYVMKGENMIETGPNDNPPPMYIFQNSGEFEFKGIEAGFDGLIADMVDISLYHSFLDPGEKTAGRPKYKTDARIGVSIWNFDFNLGGRHIAGYFAADSSDDEIDPYFVLDGKLRYHFPYNITPFVAINNITDTEYSTFVDLPGGTSGVYEMPGISFTGGFEFGF